MYICNMKKISKNTVFLTPVRPTERKFILDSMIASFRIEGIFIPEAKVQAEKEKLANYQQMMEQVQTRLEQLKK